MAAAGQRATSTAARAPGALTIHPDHQLGGAMTFTTRYRHLTAQRRYARADLRTKLAPYRGFDPRPAVVLPAQRRRFVRTEVAV